MHLPLRRSIQSLSTPASTLRLTIKRLHTSAITSYAPASSGSAHAPAFTTAEGARSTSTCTGRRAARTTSTCHHLPAAGIPPAGAPHPSTHQPIQLPSYLLGARNCLVQVHSVRQRPGGEWTGWLCLCRLQQISLVTVRARLVS